MNRRVPSFLLAVFILVFSSVAVADVVADSSTRYVYEETNSPTVNPDRGFFDQMLIRNSLQVGGVPGSRNVRLFFVLDGFLSQELPESELILFDAGLASLQRSGQRVVMRFIYDWPSPDLVRSGLKTRRARTPTLSLIALHIAQLGRVIRRHPAAVAAIESGMVGFWGEQHGDSDEKQRHTTISSIVEQWRSVLQGTSIHVLVRYPRSIQKYIDSHPGVLYENPRLGYWNDCLGAYDDENMRPTDVVIFSGETCELRPRFDYSCSTMVSYLKGAELNLLHVNYFKPILDNWERDGCFSEIERKLGYRYVIRESSYSFRISRLNIKIDNVGWGASRISRPLYLVSDGKKILKIADLADFLPNSSNSIEVDLPDSLDPKAPMSLETDDGVQFSNQTGNFLVRPGFLLQ